MGDHEGKEKVRGRRGAHDLSRRAMEGRHVLAEILVDSPTEIGTSREASRDGATKPGLPRAMAEQRS